MSLSYYGTEKAFDRYLKGDAKRPSGTFWWNVDVAQFEEFLSSNKMSLRDLAKESGVSVATLSRACSDGRITVANACRVSEVFGVRILDIFGNDTSPEMRRLRYQIGTF